MMILTCQQRLCSNLDIGTIGRKRHDLSDNSESDVRTRISVEEEELYFVYLANLV